MKNKKRIVIIGAGPGGLTAGMLLAHRGFEVIILEKEPRVGGRNGELRLGDFSFDIGPTFLHQKFTLDEMFADVGRRSDAHVDFVSLDPMTRLTWGDVSMHTFSERERMAAEIERAFPGHREGFERFMREQGRKFREIYPCLQRPFISPSAYLSKSLLKALPHVLTTRSVHDILGDYYDDERLKLAFTFQAKYLGMSPWRCPALFSILSFTEYRFGIYHTQGGLNRISHAMAEVLRAEGGEIRLGSTVKAIHHSGGAMNEVELESGERIKADAVVVNADFAHAMTRLLGGGSIPHETMRRKKFSCSTFMLYLGLDKIYHDEPHHHVIFADDYRRNVEDIQSEERVSDDMSVYVRNSCVTDPHVAPAGKSGLYVLVPTINTRHGFDWERHAATYRDRVIARIERHTGMKDLRQHIVEEKIITPSDWESRSVYLGATFNLAHTLDQMLYLRPRNRYQGFKNCFLTGGGTHPGSGLPTIYESARISSRLICDQFGVDYGPMSTLSQEFLAAA